MLAWNDGLIMIKLFTYLLYGFVSVGCYFSVIVTTGVLVVKLGE